MHVNKGESVQLRVGTETSEAETGVQPLSSMEQEKMSGYSHMQMDCIGLWAIWE